MPIGDSIVVGVGAATVAGWREGSYFSIAASGTGIRYFGTRSDPGGGGGLAIDPDNEGLPGASLDTGIIPILFRIATFGPDLTIHQGGTNDVGIEGHTAATVLAAMATELTTAVGFFTVPWYYMIRSNLLRTKDASNTVVQQVNAGFAAMLAGLPATVGGRPLASRVLSLDVNNALQDSDYSDAVHPNDAGYAKLAPLYAGAIVRARALMNIARAS